jgi:DNA-binding NarL/FixJ family response regulator
MSPHLSPREGQVIEARRRGAAVKQIAADLGIAISTVKTHLGRVFLKTNAHSSAQAIQCLRHERCRRCRYWPMQG